LVGLTNRAGVKTGILNVEAKLGKVLGKDAGVLVVKAADRDTVLSEISARMARYDKLDPEMYQSLKALRQDVKDIFNKGLQPGDDYLAHLYLANSEIDKGALLKTLLLGGRSGGKRLPKWLSRILAIKDESIRDKLLNRIPGESTNTTSNRL